VRVLITGGCKNGKSWFARDLAAILAEGGHAAGAFSAQTAGVKKKRYYLATMIPHDEEDEERIARHRSERASQSFETVEWGLCRDFDPERFSGEDTVLLDSVTALLGNEMFPAPVWDYDPSAVARTVDTLKRLAASAGDVIFVSDGITSDAEDFDPMTARYQRGLSYCERQLAASCGLVLEICAGNAIVHKGNLPAALRREGFYTAVNDPDGTNQERRTQIMELVIGGASQGKTDYVKHKYDFADNDIFDCRIGEGIDLNAPCILHLEAYLRGCVRNRIRPVEPSDFLPDAVIVCDDIFCGMVPTAPEDREWRESCGRYLVLLSQRADTVTRLFCGVPQTIKSVFPNHH